MRWDGPIVYQIDCANNALPNHLLWTIKNWNTNILVHHISTCASVHVAYGGGESGEEECVDSDEWELQSDSSSFLVSSSLFDRHERIARPKVHTKYARVTTPITVFSPDVDDILEKKIHKSTAMSA